MIYKKYRMKSDSTIEPKAVKGTIVYDLESWLINDLKSGKTTVIEQASKYTGWIE
jgi:hypothetical protein